MENKIVSLCMVIPNNRNVNVNRLFRFADLINGEFSPYDREPNLDFHDDDIDNLYLPESDRGFPLNTILMYEWSPYFEPSENRWKQEIERTQEQWIEVIESDCSTCDAVLSRLKSGYELPKYYEKEHSIIFACSSADGYDGLLIRPSDIQIRDEKIYLSERCSKIAKVKINSYEVVSCENRKSPYDKRWYLSHLQPKITGYIRSESPFEVIQRILPSKMKAILSLQRSEYKLLKRALEALQDASFTQEVAKELECSEDQAKIYLNNYLDSVQKQIDVDNGDPRIIQFLVEHDCQAVKKLRSAVEEQWYAEQEEKIREANRELQKVQEQKEQKESELAVVNEKIEQASIELDEYQEEARKVQKLQADIEEQIQKRLERLHSEKAACMVEEAYYSLQSRPITVDADKLKKANEEKKISVSYELVQDIELDEANSASDVIDGLNEVLADICDQSLSKHLALFLVSAAVCKQHLLIAGPSAGIVADLMSYATIGRPCVHVKVDDACAIEAAAQTIIETGAGVICFDDALAPGKYDVYRKLMELMPDKQFVITVHHRESLYMEPESLYSIFIPVFTDVFITTMERPYPYCANGTEILEVLPNRERERRNRVSSIQKTWFAEGFVAPLLKENAAKLHAKMILLGNEKDALLAAYEFVCMPLLKCLKRHNALEQVFESQNCMDRSIVEKLLHFAGV